MSDQRINENITIRSVNPHTIFYLLLPVEGIGVLVFLVYVAFHFSDFLATSTALFAWAMWFIGLCLYGVAAWFVITRIVRPGVEALVTLGKGSADVYQRFIEAKNTSARRQLLHTDPNYVVYVQAGEIMVVPTAMKQIAGYTVEEDNQQDRREQRLLQAPGSIKPSVEELVNLVGWNSLELPLGYSIKNDVGEAVIVDISDVHIKIIGASRKGKSCLAAAIIDLIVRTHSPSFFQIALLDMENKTSKLFENMAHLAVFDLGGKRIPLHARDPKQAQAYLHLIRQLMDHRYSLSEQEQERQPHILAYIEEFLSLKSHMSLTDKQKETLADDLNELAIRGLKVYIHLLCCAQVDYMDSSLQAFANNFGLNMSLSVRPQAASAAGFVCHDLLGENYRNKIPGQFVVEGTGCNDLCVAPDYDVKALLKQKYEAISAIESTLNQSPAKGYSFDEKPDENQSETTLNVVIIAELDGLSWQIENATQKTEQILATLDTTQEEQFRAVWGVTPGPGERYKKAKAERLAIYRYIQSTLKRGA